MRARESAVGKRLPIPRRRDVIELSHDIAVDVTAPQFAAGCSPLCNEDYADVVTALADPGSGVATELDVRRSQRPQRVGEDPPSRFPRCGRHTCSPSGR